MRIRSLSALALLAFSSTVAAGQYDTTMFRALQGRNVTPNRGGRTTTGVGIPGNTRV